MKVVVIALCFFPFLCLLNGGCAEKKILKQELTKQEIKTLKSQPEFLKDFIIDNYESKEDLDDLSINTSTLDGQAVYGIFMKGAFHLFNERGEQLNTYNPLEVDKNAKFIIGETRYVAPPPPPPSSKDPIIVKPGEIKPVDPKPSEKPELTPIPGQPKKDPVKLSDYDANVINKIEQSTMPECIQQKAQSFIKEGMKLSMSQLYEYSSDGVTYYMFDHGMAVDGPGFVLNESCDTVCVTGGMRRNNPNMKPCPPEDDYETRKVIWVVNQ